MHEKFSSTALQVEGAARQGRWVLVGAENSPQQTSSKKVGTSLYSWKEAGPWGGELSPEGPKRNAAWLMRGIAANDTLSRPTWPQWAWASELRS